MARNEQKAKDIKGLFIYQDKFHRTVYYDIFTKKGFILSNDDVKNYTWSVTFLPLAVVLFYLTTTFLKLNTYASLAVSIGFYIVAQILYRVLFLYKLPSIDDYKKEMGVNIIDNFASSYSKQRLIALVIFMVLILGATIAYVLTSGFTGTILVALWILVAITFAFLILVVLALMRK